MVKFFRIVRGKTITPEGKDIAPEGKKFSPAGKDFTPEVLPILFGHHPGVSYIPAIRRAAAVTVCRTSGGSNTSTSAP